MLVVVNIRLAAALSVVRLRRRRLLSAGARRGRDSHSNTTLMLLVVVSVFVVCELPDVGLRLAVAVYEFERTVQLHRDAVRHAYLAANALHVVNSSVNFVVYCLVGHKFRRMLGRRLATGCRPPSLTTSEEAAAAGDWEAGTAAGDGASDCERVVMAPLVTEKDAAAALVTSTVVGGGTAADQCVIVVHETQCVNTALTSSPAAPTAAATTATSD